MKNSEFNKKLKKLAKLNRDHQALLKECEIEYQKRFGFSPSEVDDDYWIDAFHYHGIDTTIEKVQENLERIGKAEKYYGDDPIHDF